jgi:hypothetical protein
MTISAEYFDASANAVADGVFIPIAALPGLQSAELASSEAALAKEAKALMSILERMYAVISPSSFAALGLTVSKSSPTGGGVNIVNQSYSITYQKMVSLDGNTISVVPVPSAGTFNGIGDFAITDVFPSAAKVAAAASTGGAGVLVVTSGLTPYTSLTQAAIDVAADSREWFNALSDHLAIAATVRSETQQSAVTLATAEAIGALDIPAAYVAATNPTSSIANVNQFGLITRAHSYTVQVALNPATQVYDVRVA